MSLTLQWVDDDLTTVLFDMNDPTGATNNTALGVTFPTFAWAVDLGAMPVERTAFYPDGADGSTLVRSRLREREVTWMQGWNAGALTPDQARTAIGKLQQLLTDDRGYIKYLGTGSASTRYIKPAGTDFISSQLRGQNAGVVQHFSQIFEPGMPMQTLAQPTLLGAEQTLTFTITNNPTSSPGLATSFTILGDAPAPLRVRMASPLYHLRAGLTTGIVDPATYLSTRKYLQMESLTLSNAASTADANASGGNQAQGTGTVGNTSTTLTTSLDGLRGAEFDVWVRAAVTAATTAFDLELSTGFASTSTHQAPKVPVSYTTTDYKPTNLGRIKVEDDAAALYIRVGWERTSGSGNFKGDYIFLAPRAQGVQMAITAPDTLPTYEVLTPDGKALGMDGSELITQYLVHEGGGVPLVGQPGTNVFSLQKWGDASFNTKDVITTSTAVQIKYNPRYYS